VLPASRRKNKLDENNQDIHSNSNYHKVWSNRRRAGFPARQFTGLSSPVFSGTGDWKVTRTGGQECPACNRYGAASIRFWD